MAKLKEGEKEGMYQKGEDRMQGKGGIAK